MTARDGKPCKKCGANSWNKRGYCQPCSRENKAKWQRDNPEKVKASNARWKRDNREKTRASSTKWQRENADKVRAKDAKWQRQNLTAAAAKEHRRRTRKTAAGGSYTAAEWKALCYHYGDKCLCCGRTDVELTADHVIPVSKGGTSNIENLQPLCLSCNSSKGNKTIDYRPGSGLGRWIQRKLFG